MIIGLLRIQAGRGTHVPPRSGTMLQHLKSAMPVNATIYKINMLIYLKVELTSQSLHNENEINGEWVNQPICLWKRIRGRLTSGPAPKDGQLSSIGSI